jgi:hypothetical protein
MACSFLDGEVLRVGRVMLLFKRRNSRSVKSAVFERGHQARAQYLHALARQRFVDAHALGDRRVRQVVEETQDEQPLLLAWHRLHRCVHEP